MGKILSRYVGRHIHNRLSKKEDRIKTHGQFLQFLQDRQEEINKENSAHTTGP
jgi:hypothetical protein